MVEFELTSTVLADILSGRAPWPTEQEFAMSDKSRDKVRGADADAPGVLGSASPHAPSPADGTETLDDGRVIATSSAPPTGLPGEQYTPTADVIETLDDGRIVQIASKGVPMPMAEARRLGLVKDSHASGPTERK